MNAGCLHVREAAWQSVGDCRKMPPALLGWAECTDCAPSFRFMGHWQEKRKLLAKTGYCKTANSAMVVAPPPGRKGQTTQQRTTPWLDPATSTSAADFSITDPSRCRLKLKALAPEFQVSARGPACVLGMPSIIQQHAQQVPSQPASQQGGLSSVRRACSGASMRCAAMQMSWEERVGLVDGLLGYDEDRKHKIKALLMMKFADPADPSRYTLVLLLAAQPAACIVAVLSREARCCAQAGKPLLLAI